VGEEEGEAEYEKESVEEESKERGSISSTKRGNAEVHTYS